MNHIYKLVWDYATLSFKVVGELAHGYQSASGKIIIGCLVALTGVSVQAAEQAKITVASGNTQVFQAPNGVQEIDIATANRAGVSHNRFNDYNVSRDGLILNNNSPETQVGALQSQLGGQIVPNQNLSNEASVIINEVVSTNPSALKGYTEVVGGTADVVVANPYGITCDGCGFINTDRVTLSTGTPQLNGNGELTGFDVTRGTIAVQGNGLDATQQNVLDLVARNVTLDGRINAHDMQIVTGANGFSYTSRSVTSTSDQADTPQYAIDSTVLGGMYANRIRLIATDAGVGVRMRGDAAASSTDFTLSANGKVELVNNHISAEQDIAVTSTAAGTPAAGGIVLTGTDGSLGAKRNVTLTGNNGAGIELTDSDLNAGDTLMLAAADITDNGSATATDAARYGANDTKIAVTNAAKLNSSSWGAGDQLSITAGSVAVNSSEIYSGTDEQAASRDLSITSTTSSGDIALINADLLSATDLKLDAKQASVTADVNTQVKATNDIALSVINDVNNAGSILSGNNLNINSHDTKSKLTNSGTIQAAKTLSSGSGSNKVDIANTSTGKVLADSITLNAGDIDNDGVIQAVAITTISTGGLDNSGTLITSTAFDDNKTSALTLSGDLTNSGQLQSTSHLTTTVAGAVDNSGTILTKHANAANLTLNITGNLANADAGILDVGGKLTLKSADLTNLGKVTAVSGTDITANTLTNGSSTDSNALIFGAQTSGVSTWNITGNISNDGALHSNDNLVVTAADITNSDTGGISSLTSLSLTANSGDIDNDGALYAGSVLSLTALQGEIINRVTTGTIDSNGSITTSSKDLTNQNSILAAGDISIATTNSFKNETVFLNGSKPTKSIGDIKNIRNAGEKSRLLSEDSFLDDANIYLKGDTYDKEETLNGTLPSVKAQIISNGASGVLSINYGNTGNNRIAVLSAPTINIAGSGVFNNESLDLYRLTYNRQWIVVEDNYVSGFSTDTDWAYWGCTKANSNCTISDNGGKNYDSYNPGGNWSKYGSEGSARDASETGEMFANAVVIQSSGAGILAKNFTFTGGSFNNIGSPWANDSSANRSVSGTNSSASISTVSQDAGETTSSTEISFAGLNLTLPTNPNGYFVVSKDPDADYLIETNPMFAVGSNFVGSQYLSDRYGYNPDDEIRRLGDDSYEAYLVRQQLINSTGGNMLNGFADEADQMLGLMNNALHEAEKGGFVYGQALTEDQINNLTSDMVWMVETVVDGQTVLVPQVYLSKETREGLNSGGAVVAANNVKIDADTVTNTGGTIEGSEKLDITAKGDITNTSGTISGGDVNITSTEGSIINETHAEGNGNDTVYDTAIGKTGGITSTGDMNLDANKNIEVTGATIDAGGDATLNAGGDITVDTIEDKTTRSSTSSSNGLLSSSYENKTTTDVVNVGSGINVGGKLSTNSGGDTVIGGSDVTAGTGWDGNAGGDIRIESRQDQHTESTESSTSGFGVGGGMYGTSTTTTEDFKGTNSGSNINVGSADNPNANLNLNAGGKAIIQGSDVNTTGDANITAQQGIDILDGLDETRHSSHTETTTIGKFSSGNKSGGGPGMQSDTDAGAGTQQNFSLMEKTVTDESSGSNTSVSSNLNAGGDVNLKTAGDLNVVGSNIEGENINTDAKNTNVQAGRNESWSDSSSTTSSIGIYTDSQAGAGNNGVNNNAGASTTATIGGRTETSNNSSYDRTHTNSGINARGNLNMTSSGDMTFEGADVESGGDMNLNATNITNKAVQDIHTEDSSYSSETKGLQLGAEASAESSARNDVAGAGSEAGANAGAEVSAGYGTQSEDRSSSSNKVTNSGNNFKSGGNFNRNATGAIVDEKTSVDAGGDINQSSSTYEDRSVQDIDESSQESHSEASFVGAAARAGAQAGGGNTQLSENGHGADASATAGIKGSHDSSSSDSQNSSSTSQSSTFKSNGSVNLNTKNDMTLEGTQIDAESDVNIDAGSLTIKSTKDTKSQSSSSTDVSAEGYIGADAEGSMEFEASAGQQKSDSDSNSSTSKGGSINGSNINIKTRKGDTTLESTDLNADGAINIDSAGDVNIESTTNSSSSSSSSSEISGSISGSAEGGSATLHLNEDSSKSSSRSTNTGSMNGSSISIQQGSR